MDTTRITKRTLYLQTTQVRDLVAAGYTKPEIWAYARSIGQTSTCSRCGGTGHHGPMQVDAGTCFKCGGSGHVAKRIPAVHMRKLLSQRTTPKGWESAG